MITDERFEKELEDLNGMLRNLRRIQDRAAKRRLRQEIRYQLNELIK